MHCQAALAPALPAPQRTHVLTVLQYLLTGPSCNASMLKLTPLLLSLTRAQSGLCCQQMLSPRTCQLLQLRQL